MPFFYFSLYGLYFYFEVKIIQWITIQLIIYTNWDLNMEVWGSVKLLLSGWIMGVPPFEATAERGHRWDVRSPRCTGRLGRGDPQNPHAIGGSGGSSLGPLNSSRMNHLKCHSVIPCNIGFCYRWAVLPPRCAGHLGGGRHQRPTRTSRKHHWVRQARREWITAALPDPHVIICVCQPRWMRITKYGCRHFVKLLRFTKL